MKRLTPALAATLDCGSPRYDRLGKVEIVHLGVGAFHRAHQAVFIDRYLARGHEGWRVIGASMRGRGVADQLNPQDGLYTVVERDGAKNEKRVVQALLRVIVAPDHPQELVDAIANPDVKIVTLTVTEKGYCLTPSGEGLNESDAAVASDMRGENPPQTAPGFIAAGLEKRFEAGAPPLTILSCDNIAHNGKRTRLAVLAMLEARRSRALEWVRTTCTFPSSMVDRIVPATTPEDIDALEASAGYRDLGMVKTEPFSQWVIEDDFCSGRPDLEDVGVQFTSAVDDWEKTKLRLLNGAHSALAYLGYLAGHEFVHTAIESAGYEAFIKRLWDEAEATLAPSAGIDVPAYRRALLDRFRNSALQHKTFQIATDGSQKLPQRFLDTIRDRLALGLDSPALTMSVAGWILWQRGYDDGGDPFTVNDPLAEQTHEMAALAGDSATKLAERFCAFTPVFGSDFASNEKFKKDIVGALDRLLAVGAGATIATFSAQGEKPNRKSG